MKKIQEMTEEEILNQVATGIHDYLTRIRPHGEFVLEKAVSAQVAELKRLYSWSNGIGARDRLSLRQHSELEQLTAHLGPRMRERASAVQLHYTRGRTLWKIKTTSAKAQIEKAFSDAGIKVIIEGQRYRAKVLALIGGRSVRLYVGFKALEKSETLPDLVQAVLDLNDVLCRIGGDVRVSRA